MKSLVKLLYGVLVVLVTRHRMRTWTRADIDAYQARRGARMLAFARRTCAYWAERARGIADREWRTLPVSTKRDLMARFIDTHPARIAVDEAFAVALAAERSRDFTSTIRGLTVGLSSGTSGHRGVFLVSPMEQLGFAGLMYSRLIGPVSFRRRRIAFFLRSNSNLYEEMSTPFIAFRYFDPAWEDARILEGLRALSPDIVVGPPALLSRLATFVERRDIALAPDLVVSGAEVLEPHERERISRALGAPVREVYQCTEGTIAASCEAGRLHVMEDIVHVDGELLGEGRVNPIVTMLHRRAQPFLRYRLDDVLVMSDEVCLCGSAFRVIARIEGRKDDVLTLPSASGVGTREVYADTVRHAVLQVDGVDEYRVRQVASSTLVVHVAPNGDVDSDAIVRALEVHLRAALARAGAMVDVVDVRIGLPHEDPHAKVRRVVREKSVANGETSATGAPPMTDIESRRPHADEATA